MNLADRFNASYVKGAAPGDCWLWRRYVAPEGYGKFRVGNRTLYAHRLAYELKVGPIPASLVIDHLCRVRHCVNPDHLEPVTTRENIRRGMSPTAITARENRCRRGHSLDDAYEHGDGTGRMCRTCSDERAKEWKREESRRLGRWQKDKTCSHGHPWTEESTRILPNGSRTCRICRRISNQRSDAKRRGKAAA